MERNFLVMIYQDRERQVPACREYEATIVEIGTLIKMCKLNDELWKFRLPNAYSLHFKYSAVAQR